MNLPGWRPPVWLLLPLLGLLAGSECLGAAEQLPPKPPYYFNDYVGVVSAATRQRLNARLEELEKTNSTQVVVVIYAKMQSASSIDDYTRRAAEAWKVGQKGKDNGAALFVFIADRQMFLQIGYGLEGRIPDSLAKRITEDEIKPHFKTANYEEGLTRGVEAIIAAVAGEYRGAGTTVAGRAAKRKQQIVQIVVMGVVLLFIIGSFRRRRGGTFFDPHRRLDPGGGMWPGWGGGGWSGGRSSGGGFGGFSGGGFSGGGGRFGGGGAGSSW